MTTHTGNASSFADPADVAAYKRAKAEGWSDQQAFRVGDNAIGFWGDSTAEGTGASCAVTPDAMRAQWGTMALAKHKLVHVTIGTKSIMCTVKDTLPHVPKHNVVIDLNPDAVRALGFEPPLMMPVSWQWA